MIRTVIGRKAAPVCTGEYPRMFCMYSETKKKTPNIASATRSIARFAPVYVRLRNSSSGSIGARWRRSSWTNARSETAASTKAPTMRADVQP